jgi:predicted ferric reductase
VVDETRIKALTPAVVGIALGAAFALAALPTLTPAIERSLAGSEPKAIWYLIRASGLVAYGLLWLSVVLGLFITSRFARIWPSGPVAFALHEHASLLALGFTLLHLLLLLGNREWGSSLSELLLPFGSPHGRGWVGLGQLAFWLLALLCASFYARKRLGQRAWRLIHFAAFASFLLALGHALVGGTESPAPAARALYWLSGGSVLFLSSYRALAVALGKAPRAARRPKGAAGRTPDSAGLRRSSDRGG